jgi:hypothetical protein
MVLKQHKARRDLHVMLGREVAEARANLHIGRKTHDPGDETPVQDVDSALMTPVAGTKRGLLHWLPFVRKK